MPESVPGIFPYQSLEDFLVSCQERLIDHAEEGSQRYPAGHLSHMCIRSANPDDYQQLQAYAITLGALTQDPQRDLVWVHLYQPLLHLGFQLNHLELTAPKQDKDYWTGPQMLVFAEENFAGKTEIASRFDPNFILRRQQLSAEQILGA